MAAFSIAAMVLLAGCSGGSAPASTTQAVAPSSAGAVESTSASAVASSSPSSTITTTAPTSTAPIASSTTASPTESQEPVKTKAAPAGDDGLADVSTKSRKERIKSAKTVSSRNLNKLVKRPDGSKGKSFVLYAQVTQFDAATGECTFRASVSQRRMSSSYDYEHNAMFVAGDADTECKYLDDVVTDDIVKIYVTSMGSYSYDTQVGGNTTVPLFYVDKISVL
ncbi:hypothetical protein [Galactobacter caseinivorans]|uniref:hypothetical protein n=1 Tax=Galactobacter caseinivorans TaxID=2676123 RepID=UPI0011C3F942|nr:hypothetical protein [Galactobacter caseinivorans]